MKEPIKIPNFMKKMAVTSNSNNIKGSRVFFFSLSLS